MEENYSRICGLLHLLGLPEYYKGFAYSAYSAALYAGQSDRALLQTKVLYIETAAKFAVSWMAVERNIRTACRIIWENRRSVLERLAGGALITCPTNSRFLYILAFPFNGAPDGAHDEEQCSNRLQMEAQHEMPQNAVWVYHV